MTNNQLTKEWLQQTIAELESVRDEIPFGIDTNSELELAAFKMALAAMDSEPVKRVNADQMRRVCLEANRHLDKYGTMAKEVNKLLGRIPTQSVPDAATAIRACLSEFPESARDIVEECADIAENACRSAMLQAEPVTTANKLGNSPVIPDTWIPVSERMPENDVSVLTFDGMYKRVHHAMYGHWQCWEPEKITHWMPLPAAPQEVKP
ncbi:DUF551 domain-containing protein [Klebsiella aerogenes]